MLAEYGVSMANPEAAFFLAYAGETPIGFAQCQLQHDYVEGTESSPVGYLEGIYVADEYRKQGVARELLSACESWAKAKGCTEFASDCEVDNTHSLRFHLNVGFEEANRIICFTKKL
jgi:aminoglycoside 6'-N-acetyltransferase I